MPKLDSIGFITHVARQMRLKRWKPEEPKPQPQTEAPKPPGLSPEEEAELFTYYAESDKQE